jgi:hypothetical protein
MKFLHGAELTRKIQEIAKAKSPLKIAVAYWGQDALKLTKINTKRKNVRVLCCLKGGKSDPKVIKKFGRRVRQYDALHAKVVWTPTSAIVSSANMSSNGLPADEGKLRGLIEAGVLLTDTKAIGDIERWFDRKYKSARTITKKDLEDAEAARPVGGWEQRKAKPGLIEALQSAGSKDEFRQQRIGFALWKNPLSRAEQKGIRQLLKEKSGEVKKTLKLDSQDLSQLDQYADWDDIPANAFLIDCRFGRGTIGNIYVTKTFDVNRRWRIDGGDEIGWVNFALSKGVKGFNYKLTRSDKNVIRKSSRELWNKLGRKKQNDDGGVIWLRDVAEILLRNATR